MVAHTFNPSTQEIEAARSEFKASLVYSGSSRTSRATKRNPVSKRPQNRRGKRRRWIKGGWRIRKGEKP